MTRKPIDDREWRLQEAAMRGDARTGDGSLSDDDDLARALASYAAIDTALRDLPPPALPADFATQVAGLARIRAARADAATTEQAGVDRWLLPALLVALGLAAAVVLVLFGSTWWQASGSAFGHSAPAWAVAVGVCAGLSFGADRIAARWAGTRGARPAR